MELHARDKTDWKVCEPDLKYLTSQQCETALIKDELDVFLMGNQAGFHLNIIYLLKLPFKVTPAV